MKLQRRQFTCWSSVFEGPGPCLGPERREHVGVSVRVGVRARVRESVGVGVGVGVCCRAGWRSQRSPVRESSRSKWPRSRCGSDSGAYPPLHLSTLDRDGETEIDTQLCSVGMSRSLLLLKCLWFIVSGKKTVCISSLMWIFIEMPSDTVFIDII